MKLFKLTFVLTVLMSMVGQQAFADWDTTTKVLVNGLSYYLDNDNSQAQVTSGEYTGDITIPSSFTYNNTNYSVTSIGQEAFKDCSSLTSVSIPKSVTIIGNSAFWGCSGLTSVSIPESVTSIEIGAFVRCSSLTSVSIPEGVMSIRNSVFMDCSSLTSVTIPNSVTSIDNHAFYGCSSLISIIIPNNITSIGALAFGKCSSLSSVTIPNSVTSIGLDAFSGTTWFDNQPDGVVYAGLNAYAYKGTMPENTAIIIEDGTKSISSRAFVTCSGLISVTIPNSVTSIGENAFYNCYNLTSITLNSNAIVSNTYTDSYNLRNIFGMQVKEYNLGDDVTSIGNYAFFGCPKLTSFIIPNSVTSIGDNAFLGCFDLTSVTIPSSVTTIGECAFSSCYSLTKVIVNDIAAWCKISFATADCNPLYYVHHLYTDENTEIKKLVIPEGVTSIGKYAFAGCNSLTSVTIPNSVTSIGNSAFESCSEINIITIPSSVTSIGETAFGGWSSLTSVNISDIEKWSQISFGNSYANPLSYANHLYLNGEEVTKVNLANDVSSYAFINCTELTEVDVQGIGTSAFDGCPNITSVKVDCDTVDNWFADSNDKVQTLTLGENVTTINAGSFYGFNALKKVYLGSNLATIGEKAFANCGKMEDVYCYAVKYPNVERNTFENSYLDYVTLHVPAASLSQYKAHGVWSKFKDVVPLSGEETAIKRVTLMNGTDSAPVIYNMNGQRIANPQKGLNIINGRKVLIK